MFFYGVLFWIMDSWPSWLCYAGLFGIGLSGLSALVVGLRTLFRAEVSPKWKTATLRLFLVSALAVGIGLALWGKTNPAGRS